MSNSDNKKDDSSNKRQLRDSTKAKTQQTKSLTSYFKTSKSSKSIKSKKQTAAAATKEKTSETQLKEQRKHSSDSESEENDKNKTETATGGVEDADEQEDDADEQEDDADEQEDDADEQEDDADEQEDDADEQEDDADEQEHDADEQEDDEDEQEDEGDEEPEQEDVIAVAEIDDMAAHPTALLAPDLFRGTTKEESEQWLDSVRHWLRYKEMNAAQSCAAIPVLLRDSALCWYNGLDNAVKNDFPQLCAAFVARYRTTGITGWQDSAAVWSLKQGENQSVDDYINLMEKRAAKTNIAAEQKRHAMIQGLRPSIRQQVLQHEIATIDDIRKWATISEASESHDDTHSAEVASTLKSIQIQLNALQMQRQRSDSPNRKVKFAFNDDEDDDAGHPRVAAMQRPDSGRPQSNRPPFKDSRRPPGGQSGYHRNLRSTVPPNYQSYTPTSVNAGYDYNGYETPSSGQNRGQSTTRQQTQQQGENRCYFCNGRRHQRFNCPAYNAVCFNCGKTGHFQSVCRAGRRQY